MCGFAGFLGAEAPDQPEAVLRAMADVLRHRGPDDAGGGSTGRRGWGLAHRRLAIVDLSPAGHRPMVSASGRLVIAFNGEVYNHAALRQELAPAPSRLHRPRPRAPHVGRTPERAAQWATLFVGCADVGGVARA